MTVLCAHSVLRLGGGRNLWRAKSVFRQFSRGYASHSEEVNTFGVGGQSFTLTIIVETNRALWLSHWTWGQNGAVCWIFNASRLWGCRTRWLPSIPGCLFFSLKQCLVESHNHVRKSVGIFDVGHMVQSKWDFFSFCMSSLIDSPSFRGQTVTDFLEWLTPSSLASLKPYTSTLSVLLNENGGIIDDTIVTKHAPDAFYVVTNAGRRERDLSWFKEKLDEWNATDKGKQGPVELEVLENWGLLALQGKSLPLFYQRLHVSYLP